MTKQNASFLRLIERIDFGLSRIKNGMNLFFPAPG